MTAPAPTDACPACGGSVRSCLSARRACCPDCSDRSHREGRFRAWLSASASAYAMLCRAAGMMSDGARAGEDISWAQAERELLERVAAERGAPLTDPARAARIPRYRQERISGKVDGLLIAAEIIRAHRWGDALDAEPERATPLEQAAGSLRDALLLARAAEERLPSELPGRPELAGPIRLELRRAIDSLTFAERYLEELER